MFDLSGANEKLCTCQSQTSLLDWAIDPRKNLFTVFSRLSLFKSTLPKKKVSAIDVTAVDLSFEVFAAYFLMLCFNWNLYFYSDFLSPSSLRVLGFSSIYSVSLLIFLFWLKRLDERLADQITPFTMKQRLEMYSFPSKANGFLSWNILASFSMELVKKTMYDIASFLSCWLGCYPGKRPPSKKNCVMSPDPIYYFLKRIKLLKARQTKMGHATHSFVDGWEANQMIN